MGTGLRLLSCVFDYMCTLSFFQREVNEMTYDTPFFVNAAPDRAVERMFPGDKGKVLSWAG